MSKYFKNIFILVVIAFLSSCVSYEDSNFDKIDYKRFDAWYFSQQSNRCYIYSFPLSSYGFFLTRGIHYLEINDKKEVLVVGGLPYKEDSEVKMVNSSETFSLTTINNQAWSVNNSDEIISTFINNKDSFTFIYSEFDINSSEEQITVDKYNMKGFSKALEYMANQCSIDWGIIVDNN